ncbi:MAG TPA: 3-oxoacyl-[acyl-carrier-protein] reductase [Epulopiscium sp.]|nr:3-oxoacyl-[acyl-carrier-protein] reductase [Candidatus Epulonipiscium sp.]
MLKNKVALITGGSRGIGKAIALLFASQGAVVVINYSSSEDEADQIVKEIEEMGGKAMAIGANVANGEDAKAMIKKVVSEYGTLDILVNNAGITKDMLLLRMTELEFDDVIDVNLKGVFNCTKHASRVMMKKGGSIINMSSISGVIGNIGQSNYAASKAGVIGFTKSVAREFAGKNLRVNVIAPGFVETDMTDKLAQGIKDNLVLNIPMGRIGDAKEIANTALFLASDLSSYITGQVINVNGGMAM